MERWLSVRVLVANERPAGKPIAKKSGIFFLISKKIVPLAVDRNRIRRLLREALRVRFPVDDKKIYYFKVLRAPVRP